MKPVIRRILVATDFSPASESAVDYAALLALALWPSVHVIHVVEEPFLTRSPGEFYSPDVPSKIDSPIAAPASRQRFDLGRPQTRSLPPHSTMARISSSWALTGARACRISYTAAWLNE